MTTESEKDADRARFQEESAAIHKATADRLRAMWPGRIEEDRLDTTELLAMASTFTVLEPTRGTHDGVTVELRRQEDGSVLWGVYRHDRCCLAKDGHWEIERLPSNREDDFYTRCRWETLGLALAAAKAGAAMIKAERRIWQECAAAYGKKNDGAT